MISAKIYRKSLLALGVILPWLIGLFMGYGLLGAISSFGSYLMVVSFPKIPCSLNRFLIIIFSCFSFSLFATIGSMVKVGAIEYYLFAIVFAICQGIAEIKQGYLRLPIALSTLAYFLSIEQIPVGYYFYNYGLFFFIGTLVGGLAVLFWIPTVKDDQNSIIHYSKTVITIYFMQILVFVILGCYLSTFFNHFHSCWLTAAGLRVIKPTYTETLYRIKSRGLGTLVGAILATFILFLTPFSLYHLIFVYIMVFCMLMIGAKKYGWWSLCLTSIALSFDFISTQFDAALAIERIELTIIGVGVMLFLTVALNMISSKSSKI